MGDKLLFLSVVLAALVLLCLPGCRKGEKTTPPPQSRALGSTGESGKKDESGAGGEGRTLTIGLDAAVQTRETGASSTSAKMLKDLKGKEVLLSLRKDLRVFPEDFNLGRLQEQFPSDANTREVLQVIEEFFKGLAMKKIDIDTLHPEWKESIVRSLQYHLDKGYLPLSLRTGKIEISEAEAHGDVRLFGDPGIAEGEVFLERYGEKWYITDIQIDLSLLAEKYKRETTFEPSTFKWMGR
ncbi:MAG: hypothetical protein AB1798_09930 [Spirochaetota bacterium]